jgi:sugar phosphate isomerase/epimerase
MKLAFSSNAFKRFSLEESIISIAGIGYSGIEILCDLPHAYPPIFEKEMINMTRDLLSKYSIQISNLNAFTLYAIKDTYHPSWIEDKKELRELRVEYTKNCIKLAKKLGCKNISTEPGGPIDRNTKYYSQYKDLFIDEISAVAPIAQTEGINVLVEPEPGLLLENSTEFLSFIKNISSDYIRLNFDIGHFYCVREDPAELIYKLSDYIEHFHLADIAENRSHNHLIPGKGSINFESVFKAIKDIGYTGFITVELYPYQESPKYAAAKSYEFLRNLTV